MGMKNRNLSGYEHASRGDPSLDGKVVPLGMGNDGKTDINEYPGCMQLMCTVTLLAPYRSSHFEPISEPNHPTGSPHISDKS